jgi:hypothetical protein
MANANSAIAALLRANEAELISEWVRQQEHDLSLRNNLLKAGELEQQARTFLAGLIAALEQGGGDVTVAQAWAPVRDLRPRLDVLGGIAGPLQIGCRYA